MLGGQTIQTGYNYFGSFVLLIGVGRAQTWQGLWNADTNIWAGGVDYTAADSEGKVSVTTAIGQADLYFGLPTQQPSAFLSGLTVDYGAGPVPARIPAWKNLIYAVFRDAAFGSQVTPPVIRADVIVRKDILPTAFHIAGGDIGVPELIYWLLTDPFDGFAIDPLMVDIASFTAAGDTTFNEVLISGRLDNTGSARDLLIQLLSYIDGHIIFLNGKLTLRLVRQEDASSAPSLTEADFMDEPEITNEQYDTTWNRTLLSFAQRPAIGTDPQWDDSAQEPYDDPANAAIVGQEVIKTLNFPFVTQRGVAHFIARRIGMKAGLPAVTWTVDLKPKWKTLQPCDLIKVSYARFGISNRVLRVTEVKRGGASDPKVTITAMEETRQSSSVLYSSTFTGTVETGPDPISTTPRLSTLPAALLSGAPDGFLVAMNRPSSTTISAGVFWTFDPGVQDYIRLSPGATTFPAKGTVTAWHKLSNGNWTLRVQMDSSDDLTWLQALVSGSPAFFAVVGERKWKTVGTPKDEHQIMSPWLSNVVGGRFALLGSNTVDIELAAASAFGTDSLSLEQLAVDGNYPTTHIYFGRSGDFFVYPTEHYFFGTDTPGGSGDTAYVRYIKCVTKNGTREQTLSEVTETTYARHDPTMNADGTYSRDWGTRAVSTYEAYDLAAGAGSIPSSLTDIDEALYAILMGTATADQHLLADHINDVLGSMAADGHAYYNV
jgi:hypothetical protein